MVLIGFILVTLVQSVTCNVGWMCSDILSPTSACSNLQSTGQCSSISVRRLCQRTCNFCDETWTVWSLWGDCNAENCTFVGERIRIRECPTLIPCYGPSIDRQPCARLSCNNALTMDICDYRFTFVCPGVIPESSRDCVSRTSICDGIADCFDGADESNCSLGGGPTDAFQIEVNRNCLQVNQSFDVFFVRHCGTPTAPYYHRFLWKWFGHNNLINVQSRRCLSQNPTTNRIVTMPCDVDNPHHQWACINTTLVVLQNVSAPVQNRYINIDLVNGQLTTQLNRVTGFQWILSGINKSLCDVKSKWSSWSSWSVCSSTCISVGMGIRSRFRSCMNGEPGRGGCNGSAMIAEQCRSASCRAECPAGFTRSGGICVLLVKKPMTLNFAKDYCKNLQSQGVSYNAKLASDKSYATQLRLIREIRLFNITRFYVGVQLSIVDGNIQSFKYTNDDTVGGNLTISRGWQNITLNLTDGWPGSNGAFYSIASATRRCLNILSRIQESQVTLDDCDGVKDQWTLVADLLFNRETGLCLGRNNMGTFQWSFVGKKCNLRDDSIKWDIDGPHVKPVGRNLLLSVENGSTLVFRDPLATEWFLNSVYNGPTNMLEARDWDGEWFIIRDIAKQRCVGIEYYIEANSYDLFLVDCDPMDFQQRWSFLWKWHVVNRYFMKCLTLADLAFNAPAVVSSGTEVIASACVEENNAQRWEKVLSQVDGEKRVTFVPFLNGKLILQTQCRFLSSTDVTSFCVINPADFQPNNMARGRFELYSPATFSNLDEAFMLHSSNINDVRYCLMPRSVATPLNNTVIIVGECGPTIGDGSWWYWSMSGTGFVNAACPGLDCCLTLAANSYLTLETCRDTRFQGWRIIKGTKGYRIASMARDEFVIALNLPLQDYSNFAFTPAFVATSVNVGLRNLNESIWKAVEFNGAMGALSIMSDCWQGPPSMYKGRKSWTSSGIPCQSWRRQRPQTHLYLQHDGPFCRNPFSYRDDNSAPWCLTQNPSIRFESCSIPRCPNLGVIFHPKNWEWTVSGGIEELPFLCEAEVECVENFGFDYAGLVQTSWSGKSCLNWLEQAVRLDNSKPGFYPNHTFCRNPDKDENGPWCWISFTEKEYCTQIKPCAKRCMEPPDLYRGRVFGVFHSGEGEFFMNGSTILYECNVGYTRSYSGVSHDLTCRKGKWVGSLPVCLPIRCSVSSLSVTNASPIDGREYVGYNSTISFRCNSNYAFDPGMDTVTFICNDQSKWSITNLPNRLSFFDRSNVATTSSVSCVKPCDDNMVAIGQWCIQILRDPFLYSFHKDSITCNRFTNPLPLEAALTSDMQVMLSALSRERFQFNAQWYNNQTAGLFTNLPRIRSAANGKFFDSGTDYLRLQFLIATSSSLQLTGFPDQPYCFAASGSSSIAIEPCPVVVGDVRFLFRWISDVHLMSMQNRMCLTGLTATSEVELQPCEVMNLAQHWFCDGQRLHITGVHLERSYLQVSAESYGILYQLVNQSVIELRINNSRYASNFYAGEMLVATLGEYRARSNLCSDVFKPTHRNFPASCQTQAARGLWDAVACNRTQYNACESFFSTEDAPLTLSTGSVWCTRNDDQSITFATTFVTPGDWCVGLLSSRDGQFSQIAEVPCESAVTEKLCARKARFVCSIPPTEIENGLRITPNGSVNIGNKLNRVHNASLSSPTSYAYGSIIFYACRYGYHFNDDSSVKQAECLLNSSWHPDPRSLACVPITCFRPRDRVNAQPFSIPKDFIAVPVGTSIRLSCLSGFAIDSNSRSQTSTCTNDGVWEPPLRSCQTMQCAPPPRMSGMQITGDLYRLNNVVTYNCEFGNFLLFPSGNMVLRSEHTCDISGNWVPDVALLQCVDKKCPDVPNVIKRYMTGNQEVITIGCEFGDTLYRGSTPVEGGLVRSCCQPNGEWDPPVFDLQCSYTYCPDPMFNIPNGHVVRWMNTVAGSVNAMNPILNATAEVSCNEGYHVYPAFRIFASGASCLQVERTGVQPMAGRNEDCRRGDEPAVYWQWWAPDDSHLLHIASGLCLSSSLPASDVRRLGYAKVTMEKCAVGNKRQAWDCRFLNGRYLRLVPDYPNSSQEPVILRYSDIMRAPIASTSLDGSASQWQLVNGSALCMLRAPDNRISMRCSRVGVWVPDYKDIACAQATCRIPTNLTGIVFNNVISPDGKKLSASVTTRPFEFGTAVIASCAEGYKSRDPEHEGAGSSIKFVCGFRSEWIPSLNDMQCDPIFCEALTGKIQNARLSQDLSWTYLSVVKVTCKAGLWFDDLKQTSRNLTCGRDALWNIPPDVVKCALVQCRMNPPIPDKASIVLNSTGRLFGDARIVRCGEGLWYKPGIFEYVVRCSAAGVWLPEATCVEIGCDEPPFVNYANLRLTSNAWKIGDSVEYECTNHRRLIGSNETTITVKCQNNGQWIPNPVTLACHLYGCLSVETLRNRYSATAISGEHSNVGAQIFVTCARGHMMRDQTNQMVATCQSDRLWYPRETSFECLPITCGGAPPAVANAVISTPNGSGFGAVAIVTCNRGFIIQNLQTNSIEITCNIDGMWMPRTSSLLCSPSFCIDLPATPNRSFRRNYTSPRAEVNGTGFVSCDRGYWLEPDIYNFTVTCDATGRWLPTPNCIPITCVEPEILENADRLYMGSKISNMRFVYQQVLEYRCTTGFWITPGMLVQRSRCLMDGTWTHSRGTRALRPCVPIFCPKLPIIPFADVVAVDNAPRAVHLVGVQITYQCRLGRRFNGSQQSTFKVTCSGNSSWIPSPFGMECITIKCPVLQQFIKSSDDVEFGSTVTLSCPPGFSEVPFIFQPTVTCAGMGNWQPSASFQVACKRTECRRPPNYANAIVRPLNLNSSFFPGDSATVACSKDFLVSLTSSSWIITCDADYKWVPGDLQCVYEDNFRCDLPPTVANSLRSLPSSYTEGQTVTYTCNRHYWFPNDRIQLQATCVNGGWVPDPIAAACTPVTCPDPGLPPTVRADLVKPANLSTFTPTTSPTGRIFYGEGTLVDFMCQAGLWMANQMISLRSECVFGDFQPDPLQLQCTSQLCGEPLPDIRMATVEIYVNTRRLPEAKYTCNDNFIISPPMLSRSNELITVCGNTSWIPSPLDFQCIPLLCAKPPTIVNGYYMSGGLFLNNTVLYRCESGYRFASGNETRPTRCVASGVWNPNPRTFSCVEISCGSPIVIGNTLLSYSPSRTKYLDTARYSCRFGQRIEGSASRTVQVQCQSDMRWRPEPVNVARCVDVTCDGALPFVPNTSYSFGSIKAGSYRTYVCRQGYSISPGVNTLLIQCQFDGTWSSAVGRCALLQCGGPPAVNGATVLSYNRVIDVRGFVLENATYKCDNATWISDGFYKSFTYTTKCINGAWNPNPTDELQCVPVICDVLPTPQTPPGGKPPEIIRSDPELAPVVGSTVQYNCPYGQYVKSQRKRRVFTRCQADGTWTIDAQLVFCEQLLCPRDYDDPYAVWTHQNAFTIGSKSQVICSPLFRLKKDASSRILECSEDGRWEPEGKCLPIACPDPNITNAIYNVTGPPINIVAFPASSQVDVGCPNGYTISRISRLTCQVNGVWSPNPSLLRCIPNQCPLPASPPNAVLVGKRGFNQTLYATCENGYTVSPGMASVGSVCQLDRSWSVDLSAVKCLPARCSSLGTIQFGSISPRSPSLQYASGAIIQAACTQGYWFRRRVTTMFIRCGSSGMWDPFVEKLACTRIICPQPKEIKHATSIPNRPDRFVGDRFYYECDPLYWVAMRIAASTPDLIFYRWILKPKRTIELTCTLSGNWNVDPESVYCLSSTEVNEYEIRNEVAIEALPFENVVLRPVGNFKWLNRNAFAAISDPGNGSEIRMWISRLANNARRGLNLNGLQELQNALRDPRFRFVLRDVINLARSNAANCSTNASSGSCLTNLATMRLLSGARDLVNLNEQYLSQIVATALDARNTRLTNTALRSFNSYTVFATNDISALIDGDPLRAWTPNPHALTWQFEIHMGSLYSIREIMMISMNHTVFNLTFSSNNQTFSSVTLGPINTRNIENADSDFRMSLLPTSYGLQIMLSDFGDIPTVLLRFAFDFPPIIGEVNIKAAPSSWLIYTSPLILLIVLLGVLVIFCILLPIVMVFDFRHLKECSVQWFGGFKEGIPCILKIRTAAVPKEPVDVFVRVITSPSSRTPIAWIKYKASRFSIFGNNLTLGFFVPRPKTDYIGVYILCTSAKHQDHVYGNPQPVGWKIRELGALCDSRFWIHYRHKPYLELCTNRRFGFSLQNQNPIWKDAWLTWLSVFAQHHVLTFFRPRRKLFSYQYFTLTQRLFSILACLSTALFLYAILYVYSDILSDVEEVRWFGKRFFAVSSRSALCAFYAFCCAIFILALLRVTFVGISRRERNINLIGKGRTAILPVPGRTVYNMIMTGSPSLHRLNEIKSSARKTDKPALTPFLPKTSQMILWLMERNFKQIPRESKSAGIMAPSAGCAGNYESGEGFSEVNETSKNAKPDFKKLTVKGKHEGSVLQNRAETDDVKENGSALKKNYQDVKQKVSFLDESLPKLKDQELYDCQLAHIAIEPSAARKRRKSSTSDWIDRQLALLQQAGGSATQQNQAAVSSPSHHHRVALGKALSTKDIRKSKRGKKSVAPSDHQYFSKLAKPTSTSKPSSLKPPQDDLTSLSSSDAGSLLTRPSSVRMSTQSLYHIPQVTSYISVNQPSQSRYDIPQTSVTVKKKSQPHRKRKKKKKLTQRQEGISEKTIALGKKPTSIPDDMPKRSSVASVKKSAQNQDSIPDRPSVASVKQSTQSQDDIHERSSVVSVKKSTEVVDDISEDTSFTSLKSLAQSQDDVPERSSVASVKSAGEEKAPFARHSLDRDESDTAFAAAPDLYDWTKGWTFDDNLDSKTNLLDEKLSVDEEVLLTEKLSLERRSSLRKKESVDKGKEDERDLLESNDLTIPQTRVRKSSFPERRSSIKTTSREKLRQSKLSEDLRKLDNRQSQEILYDYEEPLPSLLVHDDQKDFESKFYESTRYDDPDSHLSTRYDDPDRHLSTRYDDPDSHLSTRFDDQDALTSKYDDPDSHLSTKYDNPDSHLSSRYDDQDPLTLKYDDPDSHLSNRYDDRDALTSKYDDPDSHMSTRYNHKDTLPSRYYDQDNMLPQLLDRIDPSLRYDEPDGHVSSRYDDKDTLPSRHVDRGGLPSRYVDRDDLPSRYDRDDPSLRFYDPNSLPSRYDDQGGLQSKYNRDAPSSRYYDPDSLPSRRDGRGGLLSKNDDHGGMLSKYDDEDDLHIYDNQVDLPLKYDARDGVPLKYDDWNGFQPSWYYDDQYNSQFRHDERSGVLAGQGIDDGFSSRYDYRYEDSSRKNKDGEHVYDDSRRDGKVSPNFDDLVFRPPQYFQRVYGAEDQELPSDSSEAAVLYDSESLTRLELLSSPGGEKFKQVTRNDPMFASQYDDDQKEKRRKPRARRRVAEVISDDDIFHPLEKDFRPKRQKITFKERIPKEFPDTSSSLKSSDYEGQSVRPDRAKDASGLRLFDDRQSTGKVSDLSPDEANYFLKRSDELLTGIIKRLAYQMDHKPYSLTKSEPAFHQVLEKASQEIFQKRVSDSELLRMHKKIENLKSISSTSSLFETERKKDDLKDFQKYLGRLAYQTREYLRLKSGPLLLSRRQSATMLAPGDQSRPDVYLPQAESLLEKTRSMASDDKDAERLAMDKSSRLTVPIEVFGSKTTSPLLSQEFLGRSISAKELSSMYDDVLKVRSRLMERESKDVLSSKQSLQYELPFLASPLTFGIDEYSDAVDDLGKAKVQKGAAEIPKLLAISRPTRSQLAIASGRKTIYPQRNEILTHFSLADFCTFKPSSWLILVVGIMSALMLLITYDINANNNVGQSGKFMLDTLILLLFATLVLGTSIEALFVSLLVYCGKVRLDIDFENEVKKTLKKHEGKTLKFYDAKRDVSQPGAVHEELIDTHEFSLHSTYKSRALRKSLGTQSGIRFMDFKKAKERLYKDRIAILHERVLYPRRVASSPAIIPVSKSYKKSVFYTAPEKPAQQVSLEAIPVEEPVLESVVDNVVEKLMPSEHKASQVDVKLPVMCPGRSISLCSLCPEESDPEESWLSRFFYNNFWGRSFPCSVCQKMKPKMRLDASATQISSEMEIERISICDEMCPHILEKDLNLPLVTDLLEPLCSTSELIVSPYIFEKERDVSSTKGAAKQRDLKPKNLRSKKASSVDTFVTTLDQKFLSNNNSVKSDSIKSDYSYIRKRESDIRSINGEANSLRATENVDGNLKGSSDVESTTNDEDFQKKERDVTKYNEIPEYPNFRERISDLRFFNDYAPANPSVSYTKPPLRISLKNLSHAYEEVDVGSSHEVINPSASTFINLNPARQSLEAVGLPQGRNFVSKERDLVEFQHGSPSTGQPMPLASLGNIFRKQLVKKRRKYIKAGRLMRSLSEESVFQAPNMPFQFPSNTSIAGSVRHRQFCSDLVPKQQDFKTISRSAASYKTSDAVDNNCQLFNKHDVVAPQIAEQQAPSLKADKNEQHEIRAGFSSKLKINRHPVEAKTGVKSHNKGSDDESEDLNSRHLQFKKEDSSSKNSESFASEKIDKRNIEGLHCTFSSQSLQTQTAEQHKALKAKASDRINEDVVLKETQKQTAQESALSRMPVSQECLEKLPSEKVQENSSVTMLDVVKDQSSMEIRELRAMLVDIRESIQDCIGYEETNVFCAIRPSAGPIKEETVSVTMSCLVLTKSMSDSLLSSVSELDTADPASDEMAVLKDEIENVQTMAEKYLQVGRDNVPSSSKRAYNMKELSKLRDRFNRLCNTVKLAHEI